MTNVIEFNHVWKKFKKGEKFNSLRDAIPNLFRKKNGLEKEEFWALKDVSFEVKKGDVLGIIGPNGAGKSTILKSLSRIIKPNKGEVTIKGRLSALIEVGAGFHNDLTGRENVYLNGTILGMTRKEITRKFDEIVEFSGIREFIDTPVKRYSSGMYSRLGFSVAAHMDPDILLVDEVLAVGDISFQARCAQKMRELLSSGTTIVLVSHSLSLIQSLCKRVILLSKGEIAKSGTADEVIPYYENLVYKEQEKELEKKNVTDEYLVKVKQDTLVDIANVTMSDGQGTRKEVFNVDDSISIQLEYLVKRPIENPIFSLDIIRADGVLCCSFNTKDGKFPISKINGKGKVKIQLGQLNLAPGIYITKFGVWDKELVHPYVIRKKEIFRVEAKGLSAMANGVFLPKIEWKLDKDP